MPRVAKPMPAVRRYSSLASIAVVALLVVTAVWWLESGVRASGAEWSVGPSLDTPRWAFGAAAVGGDLYAFGGINDGTTANVSSHETSDGASPWVAGLATLTTARNQFAAVVLNDRIYAIGGDTITGCCAVSAAVEEYDPVTDVWTAVADMPTARELPAASALGSEIYVLGGGIGPGGSPNILDTVEVYDAAGDSWSTAAPLNTEREAAVAAAANGKLYAIGGENLIGGRQPLDSVEMYDPGSNTWADVSPLPQPRSFAAAVTLSNKIYVFGGIGPDCPGPVSIAKAGAVCNTVFSYDPVTDTWSIESSMPTARHSASAIELSGTIYVLGGSPDADPPRAALSVVEVFAPKPAGKATPTVPPSPPVGGVVLDAELRALPLETTDPDSSPLGIAVGIVAAASLAGAAWYARRLRPRRLRRP